MKPILFRAGFDTVEYAVSGRITELFLKHIADAKDKAIAARKPHPIQYKGLSMLVQPSGGQGGFTYLISTGPYGATIKFRDIGSNDPFCAHVKMSAYGLATKGIKKLKAECDDFFEKINSVLNKENTRISRLDYALDFYAPNLIVDANEFITHAKRSKSEQIERQLAGDRVTYLRIGKMPRMQLCVYDKYAQIQGKADLVWRDIYSQSIHDAGLDPKSRSWWRVEFRLGKNAIDKFVSPRLWDSVLNKAALAFQAAGRQISWRQPTEDTNRSRWSLHPIWGITLQHLRDDLEVFPPVEISEATKRQIAEDYLANLEAQCEGLVLTIAAAYDVQANAIEDFVKTHFMRVALRLSARLDIEDQIKARRERQLLLGLQ